MNRRFLIVEEGVRPGEAHLFPGREYPALYRGKAAGGEGMEDTDGVVVIESLGRLSESDLHVRMSTLAG